MIVHIRSHTSGDNNGCFTSTEVFEKGFASTHQSMKEELFEKVAKLKARGFKGVVVCVFQYEDYTFEKTEVVIVE